VRVPPDSKVLPSPDKSKHFHEPRYHLPNSDVCRDTAGKYIGLVMGWFLIPSFKKEQAGKLDIPGAITAAVGFSGLLYALSKKELVGMDF